MRHVSLPLSLLTSVMCDTVPYFAQSHLFRVHSHRILHDLGAGGIWQSCDSATESISSVESVSQHSVMSSVCDSSGGLQSWA
jgi:hypothetical protein